MEVFSEYCATIEQIAEDFKSSTFETTTSCIATIESCARTLGNLSADIEKLNSILLALEQRSRVLVDLVAPRETPTGVEKAIDLQANIRRLFGSFTRLTIETNRMIGTTGLTLSTLATAFKPIGALAERTSIICRINHTADVSIPDLMKEADEITQGTPVVNSGEMIPLTFHSASCQRIVTALGSILQNALSKLQEIHAAEMRAGIIATVIYPTSY